MIRQVTIVATLTLAVAVFCGAYLTSYAPHYMSSLKEWRSDAVVYRAGPKTAALFDRAVESKTIVWDAAAGIVTVRVEAASDPMVKVPLFQIKEIGATIAAEMANARAQTQFIAIRTRAPECVLECETPVKWHIERSENRPSSQDHSSAAATASAAAAMRIKSSMQPLANNHFIMWRGAGFGYSQWTHIATQAPLRLSAALDGVDQIDIIGALVTHPSTWRVKEHFCRSNEAKLRLCANGETPAAQRLERTGDDNGSAVFTVSPMRVVPKVPIAGVYRLSQHISVRCDPESQSQIGTFCLPVWDAADGPSRYAAGPLPRPQGGSSSKVGAQIPEDLKHWIRPKSDGTLIPTAFTVETGADAIIGGSSRRNGTLLGELEKSAMSNKTLSLDPKIQDILAGVIAEAVDPATYPTFAAAGVNFPYDQPLMSMVVLDLRANKSQGAILGASGLPRVIDGLSEWDLLASTFDAGSFGAVGAPAWTGRGWHHTPGSVWKLLTSLALIDAIAFRKTDLQTTVGLREVLTGADAASANRVLGVDVLSGENGLCVPARLDEAAYGTDLQSCKAGFTGPVRDSGAGGPLRAAPDFIFGLREALAVSSNIWFASALLTAETSRADQEGLFLVEQTANRLGLMTRQPLDGGAGLDLTYADAAMVEAYGDRQDVRALADSAFGQRVQAGPLQLARLAGMIATDRKLEPTLLLPARKPERLYPSGTALTEMKLLRGGMRAVVSGRAVGADLRSGTAYGIFARYAPQIAPRVAGKTGTANRDDGDDRVSNFAGWIEDGRGNPIFAIGCAATVLAKGPRESQRVYPLCAHMSAEALKRLDASGLVKQ